MINNLIEILSAGESKMIEADVITGHLVDEVEGDKTDRIPIMGHPPSITSDLSLKEFLDAWNNSNKIIKLDFKSTEAFKLASPVIENAFKVGILMKLFHQMCQQKWGTLNNKHFKYPVIDRYLFRCLYYLYCCMQHNNKLYN